MAARGLTTEDIAARLDISASTVQFHFGCIRTKLGAGNRQEAVAKRIAKGPSPPEGGAGEPAQSPG